MVIDSTPPLPIHKFRLGTNILTNPSFEKDIPSGPPSAVVTGWTGNGIFSTSLSSGNISAQDGQIYVNIVSGSLKQTVATQTMNKYRVTFYVNSPDTSHFHSQQLGFAQLPEFHTAFAVEPSTVLSGEWQKHVYYFIASDSTSTVTIGAVGHKTGFLLDNVQIQEVGVGHRIPSTDQGDPANSHDQPMHVHLNTRGSYTALTAAWDVDDPESPVTNYLWAIGTVPGKNDVILSLTPHLYSDYVNWHFNLRFNLRFNRRFNIRFHIRFNLPHVKP